jgi:hypothetical protein
MPRRSDGKQRGRGRKGRKWERLQARQQAIEATGPYVKTSQSLRGGDYSGGRKLVYSYFYTQLLTKQNNI